MIEARFPPFTSRASMSYRGYEEHMKGLTWDKDKGEYGEWVRKPVSYCSPEYQQQLDALAAGYERGFGVHKPSMPEVDMRRTDHTPGPKKTLRELLGDGEWDSYKMFPDGSIVDVGKSKVEWLDDSTPKWHPVDMRRVDEMLNAWNGRIEAATPEGKGVDLNAVCRDTIQDMIKEKRTTQVGGTHYEEMNIQPWDFYKAIFSPAGYCDYHVGSIISYLSRHRKKGEFQDLKKALHHLQEVVRYFEEEAEYE